MESFLSAIVRLKYIPEQYTEAFVDITPVDVCSDIITMYISDIFYNKNKVKCLHIANKYSVSLTSILKQLPVKYKCDKKSFLGYIQNDSLSNLQQILLKNAFFKDDLLLQSDKLFNYDFFQSTGHYYGNNCFTINNELIIENYIRGVL